MDIYKKIVAAFQPDVVSVLSEYIDERIDTLHVILERAETVDEFRSVQGAIKELKKLKKIRDNAIQVLEARSS